jgi:hypothetical protein
MSRWYGPPDYLYIVPRLRRNKAGEPFEWLRLYRKPCSYGGGTEYEFSIQGEFSFEGAPGIFDASCIEYSPRDIWSGATFGDEVIFDILIDWFEDDFLYFDDVHLWLVGDLKLLQLEGCKLSGE